MKSFFFLKKIQGEFGHFRENNQTILSKVAKIALKIVFELKRFSHKIDERKRALHWRVRALEVALEYNWTTSLIVHRTPYTQHPTPYTLHPAPYTL